MHLLGEGRKVKAVAVLFVSPPTLFVLFVTEELFQTDAEKVNNGSGFRAAGLGGALSPLCA